MEKCNSHNEESRDEGGDYEAIITEYTRKIETMRAKFDEHKKKIETLKLEEEAEAARFAVEAEAEYMELEEAINEHRALKELQKLHYEKQVAGPGQVPAISLYTDAKDTYVRTYLGRRTAAAEMAELEVTFNREFDITRAVEEEKFIHNFCVALALKTYASALLDKEFVEEEAVDREKVKEMIIYKFQELTGSDQAIRVLGHAGDAVIKFRTENKELIKSVNCIEEAKKLFKEAKLLKQLIAEEVAEEEEVAEDGFREVETTKALGVYRKIKVNTPYPEKKLPIGTPIFVKDIGKGWMECRSDELDKKKGPWYVKTGEIDYPT